MIRKKKNRTRKLRKQLSVWQLPQRLVIFNNEAHDVRCKRTSCHGFVYSNGNPMNPLEFVCMSVCLGLILLCHSQAYLFRAGIFRFIMNKNTAYAEYSGANNTKKEMETMAQKWYMHFRELSSFTKSRYVEKRKFPRSNRTGY